MCISLENMYAFDASAKQNEEIEAGILTFKEPSPDRGPINQAPFGPGDETDAPYESDSGDYLDRDSFCTRRGSKVHSPRRKRKDRKDHWKVRKPEINQKY